MKVTVHDSAFADISPPEVASWASELSDVASTGQGVAFPGSSLEHLEFWETTPARTDAPTPTYGDLWTIADVTEGIASVHPIHSPNWRVNLVVDPDAAKKFERNSYVQGLGEEFSRNREVIYKKSRWLFPDIVVTFEPDSRQPVVERKIELPIMRLHCPKNRGCAAQERFNVKDSAQVKGKVELIGLNAARAAVATITLEESWDTTDGKCLQFLVPATLRVEVGRTLVNGEPKAFGLRVTVVDIAKGPSEQAEINAADDYCQQDSGDISAAHRLIPQPMRIHAGQRRWTYSAGKQLSGEVGVGIELFKQKFTLGMSYSRTYTAELEHSYTLSSSESAQYLPYAIRPSAGSATVDEIYWTTR